jgi:hypothetical protein
MIKEEIKVTWSVEKMNKELEEAFEDFPELSSIQNYLRLHGLHEFPTVLTYFLHVSQRRMLQELKKD